MLLVVEAAEIKSFCRQAGDFKLKESTAYCLALTIWMLGHSLSLHKKLTKILMH
jgi:hypothetical protein